MQNKKWCGILHLSKRSASLTTPSIKSALSTCMRLVGLDITSPLQLCYLPPGHDKLLLPALSILEDGRERAGRAERKVKVFNGDVPSSPLSGSQLLL